MSNPVVLKTALGNHPHVHALKDGTIASARLRFEFVEYNPIATSFRAMIRDAALDVSEMAVVNQLLATHYGKPLTALAIPLWGRLPHPNLLCAQAGPVANPADLEGRTVGIRAYGQTTCVWVRGILQADYGVDVSRINWLTMEDAHVAEYADPPSASRNTTGLSLRQLLLDGQIAAVMGERDVDPAGVRTVIAAADQAAADWVARTGIAPVNHVVTVKSALLAEHPWLAAELMDLFNRARAVAVQQGAAVLPYGLSANRASLQLLLGFAAQQQITPRQYSADELFAPL